MHVLVLLIAGRATDDRLPSWEAEQGQALLLDCLRNAFIVLVAHQGVSHGPVSFIQSDFETFESFLR